MTTKEYKEFKNIRKESLRDNMTDIEVALTDLSEVATRKLIKKKKPKTYEENIKIAELGGNVSNDARNSLENKLGSSVISNKNNLNYEYKKTLEIEK